MPVGYDRPAGLENPVRSSCCPVAAAREGGIRFPRQAVALVVTIHSISCFALLHAKSYQNLRSPCSAAKPVRWGSCARRFFELQRRRQASPDTRQTPLPCLPAGCTGPPESVTFRALAFPMYMGMNRPFGQIHSFVIGVPHVRGDEPLRGMMSCCGRPRSPCTWG